MERKIIVPNKYISKITIPERIKYPEKYKLEVKLSIDNSNLDIELQTLRAALTHYGEEHPEASGEDIYNIFEDAITDYFDQVRHNFVSLPLTPDEPIQDNRVEVILLYDGLYEWNGSATTSTRRVRVRNGGPFEHGVIYSFPREDVRFEDELENRRI